MFRIVPAVHPFCVRALRIAAALLAAALLLPAAAQATSVKTYCIGDSFQLADVLATGNESASVNLDIRIQQGTYAIGTTSYAFIAPTTIRGGYTDASCTTRNANPYNTVIDLSGGALSLTQPKGASRAKLVVDGVTIRNGTTVSLGAGTVNELDNDDGDLTVLRTRFTQLVGAGTTDTINLSVATGSGFVENVLIDHVTTQGFPACVLALVVDGSEANFAMNYVTGDFAGSVCLATGPTYYVTNYFDVENSIFWHSAPGGLPVIASLWNNQSSTFYFNIRTTLVHAVYDKDGNLFSFGEQLDADPKWLAPATGSYDLGPGSPALNFAFAQSSLGLPSNDMIGQARDLGPGPDLGALESNGSTAPTYIVSTTADSGAGSLRQAILDANANAIDQGEIIFQLPGGCPQVIALDAPLPDIISPVRIEGYSQAGASPNSDANFFFPTLCVLLKPSSGTLAYALRVPASANSGQLDVSGLGFGGFSQPIVLLGGSPHRIAGNQFGGNSSAIDLPGAGLNAISVGLGNFGSVAIGGPSPGERNLISGAAGSGINIQSSLVMDTTRCRIVNNIIGANQDYSAAVPNGWGINLAGSGCLVSDNRIVGNLYDGIWINGGNDNVLQRNVIGIGSEGGPLNFNSGWGVKVSGSNNTLGAPYFASSLTGTLNANTIAYMLNGGVSVASATAIGGNAIRGNLIHDNGIDGNALAIDLGADGATANDDGDADTGPNGLQNFPTISALKYPAVYPAPGSQNVTAYFFGELRDATPGLYRMDAYFYNGSCQPGQRGQARAYLGSYPAIIAAGATVSSFNYTLVLPNVAADAAVALTATDANGNTSEIGRCFKVADAVLLDDIFRNGYEE